MVKVNEVEVIDTSVAYTRLKRDVTAFTRIKRQLSQYGITSINKNEYARLRIEFLVRLENSLYTTNREKMKSMVT